MTDTGSPRGAGGALRGDSRTFALLEGDHATYSLHDHYRLIRMCRTHDAVAVDIETQGLGADQWKLTAVSIATADEAHVMHPVDDAAAIRDAIALAGTIVMHNSPFDAPALVNAGLMDIDAVDRVYDTLITARLAAPSEQGGHRLGQAATRFLGQDYDVVKRSLEDRWRAATGKSKAEMFRTLGLDSEAFAMYAGFDAVMTARLHAVLPDALRAHTHDHPFSVSGDSARIERREQVVNQILLRQTCAGVRLDFDVVDEIKLSLARDVADADVLLAEYGVNTSLGRELVKRDAMRALDEAGELPLSYKRLKDGSPSADKRYLDRINHPIVDALEVRSRAFRFSADYGDKLIHLAHEGRIHPQVQVCKAVTGRMSYSTPPLQQYPEAVRRMLDFETPVVSMDWASIEPVIAANLFREYDLLDHFEAGGDVYEPVAEAAVIPRKAAKTVLLAQLYGQGVLGLAGRLDRSEDETRAIVGRVNAYIGNIAEALRVIRRIGDKFGKIQTIGGRIVPIDPDPRTGNQTFYGYRGINYMIQGSAYDLLADVLHRARHAGISEHVRVAVHDELVVTEEAADEFERLMLEAPDFFITAAQRVPKLRVGRASLGTHWSPKEDA